MSSAADRTVTIRGSIAVINADVHEYAYRRLRSGLEQVRWADTPGSSSSSEGVLTLREVAGLPEGSYRIEVTEAPDGVRITVDGGPFSGVIQGVEGLVRSAASQVDGVALPAGRTDSTPTLAYRTFWTWDHSVHWDVASFGMQETGAFNPYGKQPADFVADYQRMVDFMSRHGIAAVVIYGLLRDSHGGVEAANEVCRYAKERGVRILAGVAVNSYGGIYYEGDHEYNLATWLRSHPDLAVDTSALPGFRIDDYGYVGFPHGDYTLAARSDRPEMEQWHLDGIDWLLDNVDVDGINFEFGDYAGNDPHEDMRRLLPGLVERARSQRADLWLITELGWDFLAEPDAAARIDGLPEGCAYQFTYNRSYWPALRSDLTRDAVARLPTATNLIRPHAGSQWNRQRYANMAPAYAELARLAGRTGLAGATIFGEVSDYSVSNELNYLAFARFSWDAGLDWADFLVQEVEPRLGGADAARRFLALLDRLDAHELDATALVRARDEVRAAAAAMSDPARDRWAWLEERLSRAIHSRLGR